MLRLVSNGVITITEKVYDTPETLFLDLWNLEFSRKPGVSHETSSLDLTLTSDWIQVTREYLDYPDAAYVFLLWLFRMSSVHAGLRVRIGNVRFFSTLNRKQIPNLGLVWGRKRAFFTTSFTYILKLQYSRWARLHVLKKPSFLYPV